jgi:hypothetical protein
MCAGKGSQVFWMLCACAVLHEVSDHTPDHTPATRLSEVTDKVTEKAKFDISNYALQNYSNISSNIYLNLYNMTVPSSAFRYLSIDL